MSNYPLRANKYNWRSFTPETNHYYTDEYTANFYPFSGSPHKHWLYHQRHSEVSVFFCPFSVKLCTLCIR